MSELGLLILKSFESCRLKAYWDDKGKVWTIGYGDTGVDVVEGLEITQEEAEERLIARLNKEFVPGVERLLEVDLNDDQKSALVDFAYNEGLHKLSGSTLLKHVNAGEHDEAAEFQKWIFAGGVEMKGLLHRRKAEAALYAGDHETIAKILEERGVTVDVA